MGFLPTPGQTSSHIDDEQELRERAERNYGLWKSMVEADDCEHAPVQTGMAKSWCKHCDVNMRMTDGAYKAEK